MSTHTQTTNIGVIDGGVDDDDGDGGVGNGGDGVLLVLASMIHPFFPS